jgi:ABC-type dipeptide/oligopeptide/nickel transport system permease subunit
MSAEAFPVAPGEPVDARGAIAEATVGVVRRRRQWPSLGAWLGIVWLVALLFLAVFADQLPFIYGYEQTVKVNGAPANRYALGPGWTAWFGTDSLGKDVFAKCIYGARTTLFVGVVATVIGLTVGGLIGIVAGYRRGATDRVAGILTDSLLSIPAIVLAVVMVTKLNVIKEDQRWLDWLDRRWQITLTLGILAIAPLARIVRAQTLSLREREFVLAARSVGARTGRILGREILPNLVPTMLTVAFTGLGILIAAEGGLAFLGLSVETPTPTWGKLIDLNRDRIDDGWWATVFPCLLLFMTVVSFNLIGDWLARRFDIREATV